MAFVWNNGSINFSHLDGPLHLWLLITKPHHPNDRHGDAKPIKEAEEVNDWKDVIGKGVEQGHQALGGIKEQLGAQKMNGYIFLVAWDICVF